MKPQTTTNDVMSARSSFVIMCSSTVLSPIGSSDLGESMVRGCRRRPAPARRMRAFMTVWFLYLRSG